MKNKIKIVLLIFIMLLITGCDNKQNPMHIECDNQLVIDETLELNVYYNNEIIPIENLQWSLSDYNIATIYDNILYGKNLGSVVVTVLDITNPTHYCAKRVEIVEPMVTDIIIAGPSEVIVTKEINLEATVKPDKITSKVIWESSNQEIILVDNGTVFGVKEGSAEVIVKCDNYEVRHKVTVLPKPSSITITGNNNIGVNEISFFTFNIDEEVQLISDNEEIVKTVDNSIVGIAPGKAIVTAISKENENIKGTIEVTVINKTIETIEMTQEEREQINLILENMTLKQKVGEMLNVGILGVNYEWGPQLKIEAATGLPYVQFGREDQNKEESLVDLLSSYNIGNFTVYDICGQSKENLMLATQTLKDLGKKNTGINPFITIESPGGYIMDAIVSMPTNQAMATAPNKTIEDINNLYASELQALGINSVLNCYLNNNTESSTSLFMYGSDMSNALVTASIVDKAYKKNNVILISDLSIYNADENVYNLENIVAKDYKLLSGIIQNGSQIISIPYEQYYKENDEIKSYPLACKEFITDYLRNKLNYQGIIMLDDASLSTISYDYDFPNKVIEAINQGVDMIEFDISLSLMGDRWNNDFRNEAYKMLGLYSHIYNAVENGTITEDRLNEAVTRILLTKIRNNITNDAEITDFNFAKVEKTINDYKTDFITLHGDATISKKDKVLIISESNSATYTTNSLGDCLKKGLEQKGYSDISVSHTSTLMCESILENAENYDKIYIAVSSLYQKTAGLGADKIDYTLFIRQVMEKNPNVCIIAASYTYTISQIGDVNNYILLYNCYEDDFISLCSVIGKDE